MAFFNLLLNLKDWCCKPLSRARQFFFGPPPTPPINVVMVHVTKITLDPKDTIEGVPIDLPRDVFQAELAAAQARESAVMKHNMVSDSMMRNPFLEEKGSYVAPLVAGSTLLALAAALYFLVPTMVSLHLFSSALSLSVGLAAKGLGLDPHLAGLLSFAVRLLLRATFAYCGYSLSPSAKKKSSNKDVSSS